MSTIPPSECARFKPLTVTLRRSGRGSVAGGGTVSYEVYRDGRWIGWVGDERAWLGHRHGGRRWWAAWRQDGDTAARWNTGAAPRRTRTEALRALLDAVSATGPAYEALGTQIRP